MAQSQIGGNIDYATPIISCKDPSKVYCSKNMNFIYLTVRIGTIIIVKIRAIFYNNAV